MRASRTMCTLKIIRSCCNIFKKWHLRECNCRLFFSSQLHLCTRPKPKLEALKAAGAVRSGGDPVLPSHLPPVGCARGGAAVERGGLLPSAASSYYIVRIMTSFICCCASPNNVLNKSDLSLSPAHHQEDQGHRQSGRPP